MKQKNKSIKHWLVVLVSCGLAGSSIGICVNSMGIFYTPVANDLGVLRGTFALHSTIAVIATAITSLFVAKIMHKYHYKKVLTSSVIIAGITTILMAYSNSVYLFYILGAVRGIACGLFGIVPITMTINHWFVKNHGLATSIVLSFSGVMGAICSPILTNCIANYGWQTTYIITGILIIVICLPAIFYPYALTPQQDGLLPYGYSEIKNHTEVKETKVTKFNFFTITFIGLFIFALLQPAITGITQHLSGFAETIGYSANVGALLLSAGMIGNILSKLAIGFISDRIGAIKANMIMIFINAIAIIMLLTAASELILIIAAFLFGSAYAVGAVGFALLTKHFFGSDNYTTVFPIISFATNFGSAFALSLVGYIYDFTGSYAIAFMIALGIHVINVVIIMMIVNVRNRKEQRV